MIKVECVSCKSPYDVDERRIPATGMKMRCPKCSTSFVIAKDGSTTLVGAQPSAAPPPPAKPIAPPMAASSAFAKPAGGAFGDVKPAAPQPSAASAFGAAKPSAGAAAAAFGGGANLKKTLLGAANADQAPAAAAKTDPDIDLGASDADLPAVKPAAKPAVPWGSLAPPGPESKAPPPMRPAAGPNLPKGAMGVPSQPPLAAAAAAISQKSVSTASAFGTATAKQTMIGHARNPAQEMGLNSAAAVAPAKPPEAKLKDPSDLPFVDLPAPKPVAASVFGANTNAAAPRANERPISEPSIDLPAAKPAAAAKPFAPPPKAAMPDLSIDLPAPKPAAPKPAFGAPIAPPPPKA
ncbi:MAG TPA: zinc-ribbon domain-containing protein, partial [Polyangiales bacterium]|nr:zinc-ribbon domain-containing protein [Polyangiales bacterium]